MIHFIMICIFYRIAEYKGKNNQKDIFCFISYLIYFIHSYIQSIILSSNITSSEHFLVFIYIDTCEGHHCLSFLRYLLGLSTKMINMAACHKLKNNHQHSYYVLFLR